MYKKFLAELIGTFGLAFAVFMGIQLGAPIDTPILAALVIGIFVYTLGPISGTHLNPAVTLGAWSIKKISTRDAAGYIAAQFVGAALAMALGSRLAEVPMPVVFSTFESMRFFGEAFGTAILTFGIASVVFNKTPTTATGLVIGSSLLVGVVVAGLIDPGAGFLNPAVAFALRSLDLTTIAGPIVGSIAGFWTYRALV